MNNSDSELEQVLKPSKENIKPSEVKKNSARWTQLLEKQLTELQEKNKNQNKQIKELEKQVKYYKNQSENYVKSLGLVNGNLIKLEEENKTLKKQLEKVVEEQGKNVEAFRKKDNEKDKHIKVLENKIIELTKQLEQETSEHTITPEIEEKLKRYEQWKTIMGLVKERNELRRELGKLF